MQFKRSQFWETTRDRRSRVKFHVFFFSWLSAFLTSSVIRSNLGLSCEGASTPKENSAIGTRKIGLRNQGPYQCNICGRKVQSRHSLQRHLRGHKPTFECRLCSCQAFPYQFQLINHIKDKHSKKGKFSCIYSDICKFKTSKKSNLSEHVKTVHKKEIEYARSENKKFMTSTRLKYLIHREEQKFSCDYCGIQMRRKTNLNQHMKRIHLQHDKYSCSKCNFKTKYHQNLAKHVEYSCINKTRTTPRVSCPICAKMLVKDYLQYHITNFHEKTKKCNQCDVLLNHAQMRS